MDHFVRVLAKFLLICSTGQHNNSVVNLISRVLLSAFVMHKHFLAQITLFSPLPLLCYSQRLSFKCHFAISYRFLCTVIMPLCFPNIYFLVLKYKG